MPMKSVAYLLPHEYVPTNTEAPHTAGMSVTKMQVIVPTVLTLIAEGIASIFVTLRTKNLVIEMLKGSYEEEHKTFLFGTMCPGVDSASKYEYHENSWE
jgi:hypothetical protein